MTLAALVPAAGSRELTRAYVEAGIARYERDGLEATVAYYNSPASIDGQWYLTIGDANNKILAYAINQGRLGTPVRFPATEEGQWTQRPFNNPRTAENDVAHIWAVLHDGLLFASAYFTSE